MFNDRDRFQFALVIRASPSRAEHLGCELRLSLLCSSGNRVVEACDCEVIQPDLPVT